MIPMLKPATWLLSAALLLSTGHVLAAPPSPPASTEPTSESTTADAATDGGGIDRNAYVGVTVVGATLSAIALATGVVWAVSANQVADAIAATEAQLPSETSLPPGADPCTFASYVCDRIDSLEETRSTYTTVATAAFVTGGVLGVATIVWAIAVPVENTTNGRARLMVAPLSGMDTHGAMLLGSF